MDTKPFDMNEHIYRLMLPEPFLGLISRKIDKVATDTIPTAGVWFNKARGSYELKYNPEFMAALTEPQVREVLKHEFYHIMFEHCSGRFAPPVDQLDVFCFGQGTDLAINSFLPELPEHIWVPGKGDCTTIMPGKGVYKDLPLFQTSEWYISAVREMVKNGMKEMEGGSMDDHSGWGEEGADSKLAREVIRQILEDAYQDVQRGTGWGSVPEAIQKQLGDYLAGAAKIPWAEVVRNWIRGTQRSDKQSTVRKINKRFADLPGKKIRRHCKILVARDESGSVSDALVKNFCQEMSGLSEICTFFFTGFDTECGEDDITEWKKGTSPPMTRTKHGGTDFSAPTKLANESRHNFDALIIMTDLGASKPIESRIPRMWISDEGSGAPPFDIGNELLLRI